MTRVLLVVVGLALAVAPSVLAVVGPSEVPGNLLQNGGFEAGMASWHVFDLGPGPRPIQILSPGAWGDRALFLPEQYNGRSVYQRFGGLPENAILVGWSAKVLDVPTTCPQTVRLAPGLGDAQSSPPSLWVTLGRGPFVHFGVYGSDLQTVPLAMDRAWHRYQVVMVPALSLGVLLVDDLQVALAQGDTEGFPTPTLVRFGDTAGSNASQDCGAAPDVVWDEFYIGPAFEP